MLPPLPRRMLTSVAAIAALSATALFAPPVSASPHGDGSLPLGSPGLTETRTTKTLQPGVTLTKIVRGEPDPSDFWTIEVAIPANGSPDPDAPTTALSSRSEAEQTADHLRDDGLDVRVEKVTTPATADYAPGTLGWRVRVGQYSSKDEASGDLATVHDAGFSGSAVFTGWDGAADRGPWHIDVLTIDPKLFRGRLVASYGPDIERRERTSELSAALSATAGVNAGFFVLDPAAGAPGDPAGLGVYGGRLLSEATNGRPTFTVHADARHGSVTRYAWHGSVHGKHGSRLSLDGVDRKPGLIRNCGGTPDDQPTARPLHDVTCTDPDEAIRFTPQYGTSTPAGPGVEAVFDEHGRVVAMRSPRGGALPAGGGSVQATGSDAAELRAIAHVGARLRFTDRLTDASGKTVHPRRSTYVVNGAPVLVRDGRLHVTPRRDGIVHPGDPSFYYSWAHKRNPRTITGIDAHGRVVLVTADGRSTASLGLSITESGQVAKALGLREAINLDGGGSTTMVVDGRVINDPSDATGERPIGDALLVLPHR